MHACIISEFTPTPPFCGRTLGVGRPSPLPCSLFIRGGSMTSTGDLASGRYEARLGNLPPIVVISLASQMIRASKANRRIIDQFAIPHWAVADVLMNDDLLELVLQHAADYSLTSSSVAAAVCSKWAGIWQRVSLNRLILLAAGDDDQKLWASERLSEASEHESLRDHLIHAGAIEALTRLLDSPVDKYEEDEDEEDEEDEDEEDYGPMMCQQNRLLRCACFGLSRLFKAPEEHDDHYEWICFDDAVLAIPSLVALWHALAPRNRLVAISSINARIIIALDRVVGSCYSSLDLLAQKIADAGGIPLLTEWISDTWVSPESKLWATHLLFDLAFAHGEHKRTMAQAGGIAPLVSLASEWPSNLAKQAADVLSCLAWAPENREMIYKAGGAVVLQMPSHNRRMTCS